jgi:hypothetical protein
MKRKWLAWCVAGLLGACTDPSFFSGSYQGEIRGAEFVRRGFAPGTTLQLEITLDGPKKGTGTLSTSDKRFVSSPLAPLGAAPVDVLGDADLPGTGPILLFLSAPAQSGEEALVVLSFGGEAGDEARIAYGRDGTPGALYGVFPLRRGVSP